MDCCCAGIEMNNINAKKSFIFQFLQFFLETVWTKVFIPVVPEDPHVIDFITAQCSRSMDDSISDCSDQIDDEDDAKYRRRAGKGPQFKNLVAETKRKKLNDGLYAFRALVPKISKELLKEIKELQDELEEHSDDEGSPKNNTASMNVNHNIMKP
ncbi:hypothetical protein Patl1_22224 [Pistacia atlantica]|uniref:Uncharacterized protein n=1 Tax=Pistacia atlantica TaxID=434234 RepID=A0ACC1BM82_9ROSI|nr:hypothetical protein Patl1_22224 [Pistacia atlantica]